MGALGAIVRAIVLTSAFCLPQAGESRSEKADDAQSKPASAQSKSGDRFIQELHKIKSSRLALAGGWSYKYEGVDSRLVFEPGLVENAGSDVSWLLSSNCMKNVPESRELETNLKAAAEHLLKAKRSLDAAFKAVDLNGTLAWKDGAGYQELTRQALDGFQDARSELKQAKERLETNEREIRKLSDNKEKSNDVKIAETVTAVSIGQIRDALRGIPFLEEEPGALHFRGILEICERLEKMGISKMKTRAAAIPPIKYDAAVKKVAAQPSPEPDEWKLFISKPPFGARGRVLDLRGWLTEQCTVIFDSNQGRNYAEPKVDPKTGSRVVMQNLSPWKRTYHRFWGGGCIRVFYGTPEDVNAETIYIQVTDDNRPDRKGPLYVYSLINNYEGLFKQTYRMSSTGQCPSWLRKDEIWRPVRESVDWVKTWDMKWEAK